MGDTPPISRGADLTDTDLAVIAEDMRVVTISCIRNRIRQEAWEAELLKTLRWRLGRAPAADASMDPGTALDANGDARSGR